MQDIAEEVARIWGYNKIGSTPLRTGGAGGGRKPHQQYEQDVKSLLYGMGMCEIETFSFISPKYYDKIRMAEDDPRRRSVVIKNPLGEDTSVMRTTALPSMLEVLSYNYSVKNKNVALYETATSYIPTADGELPKEPRRLVIGFYENENRPDGYFYKLKGCIEGLLSMSGITDVEYNAVDSDNAFHPGRCAEIVKDGDVIGIFGEIHPLTAENYGFSIPVYAAELNFDVMLKHRSVEKEFQPLPKYPALERDFAFVCDEDVQVGKVASAMKKAGGKHVESVELFDIYRGPQLGEGKKSVAYSVMLRCPDRTMTDDEADSITKKITKALKDEFDIVLRS